MSSRTDEPAAEAFPWMGHTILAGAEVGALLAVGLGRAYQLELSGLVLGGLFGAAAGAAVGICLALMWAVEMPPRSASPPDLWDPWLDSQNPPRDDDSSAHVLTLTIPPRTPRGRSVTGSPASGRACFRPMTGEFGPCRWRTCLARSSKAPISV